MDSDFSPGATRYARSGDVNIAYQAVGEGALDLVFVPGWVSNIELMWEEPACSRFLRRLASFSRLILFDKRGTGLSDRVNESELPTLEQRIDDVRAVMDAAGSERAALFGSSEGGNMSVLFAATYPERTVALITLGIFAKRIWAEDYPWAPTRDEREEFFRLVGEGWGGLVDLEVLAPSMIGNAEFEAWWPRYLRQSATPRDAVALARMNTEIDIRSILPSILVPTLVMQRTGDLDVNVEEGRFIGSRIPGAKYVELEGQDHFIFAGDQDPVLDEVEEFLTGTRPIPEPDRALLTILFTDIAGSTELTAKLGDAKWRDLLSRHDAMVRRELDRFRGVEVDTAGDGFLATFDGPARAARCAIAIRDGARALGMEVRSGVHTGECEFEGTKIRGIAVNIGSRIASAAVGGQVLVSSTVRDLTAGSGLTFQDQGTHELKGVPDSWHLYEATS
jgi:class 3 adenylate cyclase